MKARILLVDDDVSIREGLALYLSSDLGNQLDIVVARSGNEAIRLLNEGLRFDVIVSDYSMNDGDGAELLQHVSENFPSTPFILFTSMVEPVLPRVTGNFHGIVEKPAFTSLKRKIIEAICLTSVTQKDSVSK
ncbi:MAG: response regulator [Bdellovibrionales bacterium]